MAEPILANVFTYNGTGGTPASRPEAGGISDRELRDVADPRVSASVAASCAQDCKAAPLNLSASCQFCGRRGKSLRKKLCKELGFPRKPHATLNQGHFGSTLSSEAIRRRQLAVFR